MDGPYNLGWDAFLKGESIMDNPYPALDNDETNPHSLWDEGYSDAEEEDWRCRAILWD